jgi:hypothetical protein
MNAGHLIHTLEFTVEEYPEVLSAATMEYAQKPFTAWIELD